MRNPDLKAIATYFPQTDIERLDALAKQFGWSRSTLLQRALNVVLENPKLLAVQVVEGVGS
jgi:predicted DNA-binding protein